MSSVNYHFKQNSVVNLNLINHSTKSSNENNLKAFKQYNVTNSHKSSNNLQGLSIDHKNFNSTNNNNINNNLNNKNMNFLNSKKNIDNNIIMAHKHLREPLLNEPNFLKGQISNKIHPDYVKPSNNNSNIKASNNNFDYSQQYNSNQSPNFNVTKNKFIVNFNPPNFVNQQDRIIAFGQDRSENNFKKTLRKPAISNLIQNSSFNILNPNGVNGNNAFNSSHRANNSVLNQNNGSNGNNGNLNIKNSIINTINNNLIRNRHTSNSPNVIFEDYNSNSNQKNSLTANTLSENDPITNYNSSRNVNENSYKYPYSNKTNNVNDNSNHLFNNDASSVKEYSYKEDPNYNYRAAMEDTAKIIDKYMNNADVGLFTIYDGHGGAEIAQYLKNRLPELFSKILSSLNNKFECDDLNYDIESSINILFNKLDDEIKLTSESEYMGSTAVMVLICREKDQLSPLTSRRVIYCANVGDTRCVLISSFGVKRLSYDHKASDIQEINRVNNTGGMIFNGRVFGQLIITRAFGDHSLKRYGVIATPTLNKHFISDKDKYLVLATDGVWDVIYDEELLKLSQAVVNADELSKLIIKTALLRGTQDNVSCIVLKL